MAGLNGGLPALRRLRPETTTLARLGVAMVGIALLAAGAVAVFVTTNSAGSAALVVAGGVLLVVTLFANRLESVEGGGIKLVLDRAQAKLHQADEADASGDAEGADRLRREAELLLTAMEPLATRYEQVRANSPGGRARTNAQGDLVDQARKMARLDFVTPEAVVELFRSGQDGNRITALGLMQGNPRLASLDIVTDAVRLPRSSFEQWHALRVGLDLVEGGRSDAHDPIRDAIEVARANGTLGVHTRDQSRVRLAQRIAKAMEARA
ncbi:MAG TPA: hypothetical protein VFW65_06015 [Pseudonocardiaceae bacterium]|nr:hypothetical protein [Pseudonocardiaceae bacterium]